MAGCGGGQDPTPSQPALAAPFHFVDASAEAGLGVPTWCGRPEKPHILESNGTGLALLDHDLDGDLDAYLVNGWRLDGDTVVERTRDTHRAALVGG